MVVQGPSRESVSVALDASFRWHDEQEFAVGLTRALHIATTEEEQEAAHRLRMQFMRNVQQLSQSPPVVRLVSAGRGGPLAKRR